MKTLRILLLAGFALTAAAISHAQVAGSAVIAVAVEELRELVLGWSAKRDILGQPIHNDHGERVGSIDDLILAGASRDALLSSPRFEYAN